ncbi:glycosyl transferase, group 1 family domain protein [[Clostridium] sordellii ATCC 9714]|nr:glycosyl transferase, group 1 family domain protein [[Clostridium] sordellii ATCC 9714] [Paeniclostridium sordellii ATCC 9714]
MKKKRILMILNYFYPDVASTGQLMTELCEELQDDFDITVIAGFPNYTGNIPQQYNGKRIVKEKYKDIDILRVRVPEFDKTNKSSRIKYILAYFFNSILAIMKSGKQDIVYSISQPPILGGILGVIGKASKRAKLIYNIQDFNPEQIEAVGYSKNKFIIEAARS